MAKGLTAIDMKKKLCNTIQKSIEINKEIDIKKFVGQLEVETGYSNEFIMKCVNALENAELILINDKGIAKSTELKNKQIITQAVNNDEKATKEFNTILGIKNESKNKRDAQ